MDTHDPGLSDAVVGGFYNAEILVEGKPDMVIFKRVH